MRHTVRDQKKRNPLRQAVLQGSLISTVQGFNKSFGGMNHVWLCSGSKSESQLIAIIKSLRPTVHLEPPPPPPKKKEREKVWTYCIKHYAMQWIMKFNSSPLEEGGGGGGDWGEAVFTCPMPSINEINIETTLFSDSLFTLSLRGQRASNSSIRMRLGAFWAASSNRARSLDSDSP